MASVLSAAACTTLMSTSSTSRTNSSSRLRSMVHILSSPDHPDPPASSASGLPRHRLRNLGERLFHIAQVTPEAQDADAQVEPSPEPGGTHLHTSALQNAGEQSLRGAIVIAPHAEGHARELGPGHRFQGGHRRQALVRQTRENELLLERGLEGIEAMELEAHPQAQRTEMPRQLRRIVGR